MTRLLTLLTLLLLLAAIPGCATDAEGVTNVSASPALLAQADIEARKRAKADGAQDGKNADGSCQHVWQAVGFHPYSRVRSGIRSTDLCTIQRCNKCSKTRHECERYLRKRR